MPSIAWNLAASMSFDLRSAQRRLAVALFRKWRNRSLAGDKRRRWPQTQARLRPEAMITELPQGPSGAPVTHAGRRVLGIAIGGVQTLERNGRSVQTAIVKSPVTGAVWLTERGIAGDQRAEPRRFGEDNHAIYAFPTEHYEYWSKRLRMTLSVGQFGENLALSGMLETEVRMGDVFQIGSAQLEVAQPRLPGKKLDHHMGFEFSRSFLESRRVGYYLRVLVPGRIEASDSVALVTSDPQSPTVDEFLRISQFDTWDVDGLEHLLRARRLPAAWRDILEQQVERARSATGWYALRRLRVSSCKRDTRSVSLVLGCERGKPLPSLCPGQVLPLTFGGGEKRVLCHTYAVAPDGSSKGCYRIHALAAVSTKNTPHGLLSARLPEALGEGDVVSAAAPRGNLGLSAPELAGALIVSEGVGLTNTLAVLRSLPVQSSANLEVVHFRGGEPLPILERELAILAREVGCLCRIQGGSPGGRAQFLDPKRLSAVVASGRGVFVEAMRERVRNLPFRAVSFD
jgi:MOSC domain-containing protein YiiM/ferredoxin-NADP reductase